MSAIAAIAAPDAAGSGAPGRLARAMLRVMVPGGVTTSTPAETASAGVALAAGATSWERELREKHFQRLHKGLVESHERSSIHLDVLTNLKHINSHLTAVAYPILDGVKES